MYKSKYYLKKEINILMLRLYDIKKAFQLFKELSSKDSYELFCKKFPYIMHIILQSLKEKSLIELSKIICDEDKKSISVNDILKIYHTNKELFKEKNYYYVKEWGTNKRKRIYTNNGDIKNKIDNLENDLKQYNNIKTFLKKYRNKKLAHNDKKYGFDKRNKYSKEKVFYDDVDRFIDILIEDVNNISSCIFGVTYVFTYDEIDEVNYIKELLKN